MIVATAQTSGGQASPVLVEQAVRAAMDKAGVDRVDRVLLILSKDFIPRLPAALRAAASVAKCLQIDGFTASGQMTEAGWQLENAAVSVLILADLPTQTAAPTASAAVQLSYSGQGRLALDWQSSKQRLGLIDEGRAWQHTREVADTRLELAFPGLHCTPIVAHGLKILDPEQYVTASHGHELIQLQSGKPVDSLLRLLPGELRERPPIHQLALWQEKVGASCGVLALNSNGSMTLSSPLSTGNGFHWAIRQPLAAEQEMRQRLSSAVDGGIRPVFALMLSCIGRGPLFYGHDDCDLQAFREYFPNVPLLGAYGIGQIVPSPQGNQLLQNAALTLLYEEVHV